MAPTVLATIATCKCTTCKANNVQAVRIPETFAPALKRTSAVIHGLVWNANHPVLGAGFRAQTGVTFA